LALFKILEIGSVRNIFLLIVVLVFTSLLTGCGINESSESTNTASQQTVVSDDTVNLSWAAPSTRSDGVYLSPSDLAGYKVYMGSSANDLRQLVDLNDNQATEFTVSDLDAGSYYFAVSAYDQDGMESGFSQVIRVDVS
jgi:fibronectin type 3 domain-containing protein